MEAIKNKRAFFDYEILDTLTTGMVLQGWEVKSLRAGHGHLKGAWVKLRNNELYLVNAHISPWRFGKVEYQSPEREIKLLAHKREIEKLQRQVDEKKLTLIPTKIFADRKHLKCEIGIGKGRKRYEKKQVLKERSQKREAEQILKKFNG